MKILSIDTASNICGISILEDTHRIVQLDHDTGRTHSENLMPMIDQAFEQSNFSLKDIDLLVCDKGPGSFTGIRIGIATVKAFHDSLEIPCLGISSLEALAYSITNDGLIATLLDCKNENCYFALYELKNSFYQELIPPTADTVENAFQQYQKAVLDTNLPLTFVGDGSVVFHDKICETFKTCHFANPKNNFLNSYFLGLAGYHKFKKMNQQEDLLPFYLKKPQAQRQLEEKSKNAEIRHMVLSDLDAISSILISDFDDFWNYDILKGELNAKNSRYLLAKLDGQIVGFAGIKILVEEADIMNIVVKKNFRNQGIGTSLLQNLIDLAKMQNLSSLSLEVMEENYPAIHLYKKLGFQQVGTRKNYYADKSGILMKLFII